MSPPKKSSWHEKAPIRITIWLLIVATVSGAFYTFNNLATKNIAARSKTQAPASNAPASPAP